MGKKMETKTYKGKTRDDADQLAKATADRLGITVFGPNQTHYVNTSETDTGLLVEVWKKEE